MTQHSSVAYPLYVGRRWLTYRTGDYNKRRAYMVAAYEGAYVVVGAPSVLDPTFDTTWFSVIG